MNKTFAAALKHAVGIAPLIAVALFVGSSHDQSGGESAYVAETRRAMAQMMSAMDVPPTGDVDKDFVLMMVPHHQGAIDMAKAELAHGRNEVLRRIAQEIIVEQLQEIEAMKLTPSKRSEMRVQNKRERRIMGNRAIISALLATKLLSSAAAHADPVSSQDRVYSAEQFFNTVSVVYPADNLPLGVIRLGEPIPTNFSPLYHQHR